jgi:hypothetical protein
MSEQFTFTVDHMIGRQEVELVVIYSVTPFVAATHWQPAEGGECEIQSVKKNGIEIVLSQEEEDALLEMAEARCRDDLAEDAADEADYRYDQYRDRVMAEAWERSTTTAVADKGEG